MPNLTAKQGAFVEQFLLDCNATAAARRAGYSARTANEQAAQLLRNAKVQAALRAAIAERRERLRLDADDVVRGLLVEARGKGPDTSASARVRAWELVGKHLGMFTERLSVLHQLGALPDSELARLEALDDRALAAELDRMEVGNGRRRW